MGNIVVLNETRREYQQQLAQKQDKLLALPALLGRPSDGSVEVSTRPGYVWVRIGHDEVLGQARNKRVPPRYDLPVLVGYDGISPDFQVLSIRQETYIEAGFSPIPEVGPHHTTHEWPRTGDPDADGSDVVWVHHRQILNCRVSPGSSAFSVSVGGGVYRIADGWQWTDGGEVDLLNLKPGVGSRWALIYVRDDGTLGARGGEVIGLHDAITVLDIPQAESGEYPLAAVMLYGTQERIQDNRTRQDILDLRLVTSRAVAGAHTIISDEHTDTTGTPSNGDVLTFSDGVWVPRAPSGGSPGSGCTGGTDTTPRVLAVWVADGPLAAADIVDGTRYIPTNTVLTKIVVTYLDVGSGVNTIQVEGSTNGGTSWQQVAMWAGQFGSGGFYSSGTTLSTALSEGTLLRMNITDAATGSDTVTVELVGYPGEGTRRLLPIMGIG